MTNYFIKLPDGTIINVAHVRRVDTELTTHNVNGTRNQLTRIDTGQTVDQNQDYPADFHDPGGQIYAYFDGIAQEFGGD